MIINIPRNQTRTRLHDLRVGKNNIWSSSTTI